MHRFFPLALSVLLVSTTAVLAQEHQIYESSDALEWQQGPPSLPDGSEIVVLSGDPGASSGNFAVRLRFPEGYEVAPHNHPTTEQLTVISGELKIGMGDELDQTKGHALKPGGFVNMPANMNHFAWTEGGTVIQLQGQSPLEITYVNPKDDPRNR